VRRRELKIITFKGKFETHSFPNKKMDKAEKK
jgi:hypothetical protein